MAPPLPSAVFRTKDESATVSSLPELTIAAPSSAENPLKLAVGIAAGVTSHSTAAAEPKCCAGQGQGLGLILRSAPHALFVIFLSAGSANATACLRARIRNTSTGSTTEHST